MPITEYKDVNKLYVDEPPYTSGKSNGFCFVSFTGEMPINISNGANVINNEAEEGFKLHVSIDDNDQENLTRGWRIVSNILMKNCVFLFKIVDSKHIPMESYKSEEDTTQEGKQITIFVYKQPNMIWEPILFEITQELAQNDIKPSYLPNSDAPLKGSNYLSYRYEGASRKAFQKPSGVKDLFSDGIRNVPDQPSRPQKSNFEMIVDPFDEQEFNNTPSVDEDDACCSCSCNIS